MPRWPPGPPCLNSMAMPRCCSKAACPHGAPPACLSRPRLRCPPTPTASTTCSSCTTGTTATRRPRAATSRGRPASSRSSMRRSAPLSGCPRPHRTPSVASSVIGQLSVCSGHRSAARRCSACQYSSVCLYWLRAAPGAALRRRRAACDICPMARHWPDTAFFPLVVVRSCSRSPAMSSASRVPHLARLAIAAAWLAALALQPASADPLPARNGFPAQTVKFISPFPPGGGNDATARLVTTRLPEIMGQAAVVDNRGGAGGNIGAKAVAESRPDGYTVLTSQVSIMAVNPVLYASAGFYPVKNFVPITQINAAPLALVVDANSALKRFADLAAKARAAPGKVTYATPGNGTLSHLVGVVLAKDNGIGM